MLSLWQHDPLPPPPPLRVPADLQSEPQKVIRLPRLDAGAEREPWWREFATSLQDFFSGPKPSRDTDTSSEELSVDWIEGKLPAPAFAASCVWHVAFVWILLLPIWGFLRSPTATLAPVQIEMTYYAPPEDLPPISLPADSKPAPSPRKIERAAKAPSPSTDTFNPRQTILSTPVQVTHPRQTLIQPEAPPTPPKIAPQLPNIIQWTAAEPPKPRLELSPTASAPKMRQREIHDTAAPQILDKVSEPVAIFPAPIVNPQLQIPISAASAPVAHRRRTNDANPAPEIGANDSEDANLRRVIALSATPAPPAPLVTVPQGNLAARIAMSPWGTKAGGNGASSGSAAASGSGVGTHDNSSTSATLGTARASSGAGSSMPAAISVSGGERRTSPEASAPHRRLILNPTAPTEPAREPPRGPMNVAGMDSEMILSGKEVYTLNVNLPNLTSVSGSWILNFAQLDEDYRPGFRPKGRLAAPQPYEKVDPKYPPDAIKQHIDGEVILYAIIRKDGSVDSIQVVHSIDPQLDHNAIEALSRWKFRPASREGAPVDVEAVVHIPFRFRSPIE